jgi:transcriptional regulator with XRE-family HTH domain
MSTQQATTGTTLAGLMDQRGVKAKALANALGTDASTVSRWRGGLRPGKTFQPLIVAELGLTDVEIAALGWDGEPANV